jgi:hypothetical protein
MKHVNKHLVLKEEVDLEDTAVVVDAVDSEGAEVAVVVADAADLTVIVAVTKPIPNSYL